MAEDTKRDTSAKSGLGKNYWKLWTASVVSNFGDGMSLIAYPWLASALTRNPIAIAGVAVASRLPWLLFTLPAGVITDRYDRRRLIFGMDVARFVLTLIVALAVLRGEGSLNDPAEIAEGIAGVPSNGVLVMALLYLASLLLGGAEVLRDNSAQTLMPSVVEPAQLEKANGRLWGAEMVMNAFVGPPVAGFLLAISFAFPFFVDAGTFAVAALLLLTVSGDYRPRGRVQEGPTSFRADIGEGFRWLWQHELLRSMALALGMLNGLAAMAFALQVLYAQELLDLSAAEFGLLGISGAAGGVVGSLSASQVTDRLGPGGSLMATVAVSVVGFAVMGLVPNVPVVVGSFLVISYVGVVWNVVTVALRQRLIPDYLLGRVNSVYRFFGWGMMPIGSLVGGALVVAVQPALGREWALRTLFIVIGAAHVLVLAYVAPRLNTSKIQQAERQDSPILADATAGDVAQRG